MKKLPFVLRAMTPIPEELGPDDNQIYDEHRQIWVCASTGAPVVCARNANAEPNDPTRFGESVLTETREGVDQVEGSSQASPFGETIHTRTQEGADRHEVSDASSFGETIHTSTREGVDQSEGTRNAWPLDQQLDVTHPYDQA